MPERFEIYIVYKRRYINTLPFLSFPFPLRWRMDSSAAYAVQAHLPAISALQWRALVSLKTAFFLRGTLTAS